VLCLKCGDDSILVLAGIQKEGNAMNAVAAIDLISFLSILFAVAVVSLGWRQAFGKDTRLVLVMLLAAKLFHGTGNVLEWSGITSALDPIEDYVEVLEVMLWIFFFFTFLKGEEILERKRSEAALKESREELKLLNRELEQIVYVTSHDLRSPLVNVEGYGRELGIMLDEILSVIESGDVPVEVKRRLAPYLNEIPESLRFIGKNVSKMDSLLIGVLQFLRSGRAELNTSELDMNSILSEITMEFNLQIKDSGARVEISELPPCYGDRDQINQVFSNLIGNALKYLSSDREGVIKVYGHIEDSRSVYCVEDNGIGISPEYKEKVFDIFHQLEPDVTGEGLGLTIVRKIVEKHHGSIWVESEEGKGSRFFVSLPRKGSRMTIRQ
jgi:signal transduction histidine kinase